MSYQGISVKEAMHHINSSVNGWFLPAIQRPFVWGSRYENERYIEKLFDSILKGYPIGGLIVWNTAEEVPYREFVTDYKPDNTAPLVDKGLHARSDKWLIYDGQQRMQTLYSCLKYTFNNKVLIYNLLFDIYNDSDPDITGFSFIEKNASLGWHFIRMNELFMKSAEDEKRKYRKAIISKNVDITDKEEELIERNIDILWDVFVRTDTKSLAYFPVRTSDEKVVNEVFERLNTGGMSLSLADLLFSKIKSEQYDFEENLQRCSKKLYNATGKGYLFNAYSILQVLHLIVKKAVRVDPKKVKKDEVKHFITVWDKLEDSLISFFTKFIWGQFKINNSAIIPRNLALLPLIVYFYELSEKGCSFNDLSGENLKKINQYFIKSQINDWNLQSYVDNFSDIIVSESKTAKTIFDFPIEKIEEYILKSKKREVKVHEDIFTGYTWFALKILTPERAYQFDPDMKGRFNPEIDHIFPTKLKGRDEGYEEAVNIIWNMQPVKGEINGFKRNIHPKLFFTDKTTDRKNNKIFGSKYIGEYDFLLPHKNKSIDFTDKIWDAPFKFIEARRKEMLVFFTNRYRIQLV